MKKMIIFIIILCMACTAALADSPAYLGTWVIVHHISPDSTTFVMFQLVDDHTALYVNQLYYDNRPGMTEKGVWTWEEITDTIFRIRTDDGRLLYFEMTDENHLSAAPDSIYTRHIQEE